MRAKVDFNAAYRQGKRVSDGFFSVTVAPNRVQLPRLGLSIAAKTIGNAIARNRVRRLVRESFRLARPGLPPRDYLVGAKVAARTASTTTLRASINGLWTRMK